MGGRLFGGADHGSQNVGLERRAWPLAQAVSGSVGSQGTANVPALRVGTDTRPVRIVAATAPGSGPGICARLIGPWLSARLGKQFVVENRPGGGNNIGTEAVVRAPPDGYTLLIVSSSNTI